MGHLAGETLADSLDDAVVLDVVGVVGLELGSNAGEGSLEGLLGGGVDHLGLEGVSTVTPLRGILIGVPGCRHHRETRRGRQSCFCEKAVRKQLNKVQKSELTGRRHQRRGCTQSRRRRSGDPCQQHPNARLAPPTPCR